MSFDVKAFEKELIETFKNTVHPFNEKEMPMLETFVKISAQVTSIAIAKYHSEVLSSDCKEIVHHKTSSK
ncbi:hypothetical protein [Anaerovorax sp. IOR16]|uniref:hypothetical protein n=1 Tax=Anaerovorax sp. IOR16 TaxID=2773458 RepID=UPI0019D1E286|nr:hypothetical protein [Anaerovorax sp. IOR16]